jgi:hypothetical protein
VVIQEDGVHGKNLWEVPTARSTVTPGLTKGCREIEARTDPIILPGPGLSHSGAAQKCSARHRNYNNQPGNAWTFPGLAGKSAA